MRISSNRDSACRECKREWKVGESIHYDPVTRATCIDETCFENQVRNKAEKNEHDNSHASNTNENTANSSKEFKLENEAEFRSKIQERLAKYKIIMEESDKFLDNHCKDYNKTEAKISIEYILGDLMR